MKVAIVHDWITGMRGGERCLEAFIRLYPEADVFTLFYKPGATSRLIDSRVVGTSWLNNLPFSEKIYRHLLPLYPSGASSIDLKGYDLVISTSHAAAKNVRAQKGVPHISYCFTPMRYVWDQMWSYFGAATVVLWPILMGLRSWDRRGAERVTQFVAISRFVAARIRCFYGRSSTIVCPPVETSWIEKASSNSSGEAYLYAGALVPYKRPDLVVRVCSELGVKLWVAGAGPMLNELKRSAGPTVQFLGRVSDQELGKLYRRARALVFPGVEDFGIIPVEAMAAGRPVIGSCQGGLGETSNGFRPWLKGWTVPAAECTGVFMAPWLNQYDGLKDAIKTFERLEGQFKVERCIGQALKFSPDRFVKGWQATVQKVMDSRITDRFISNG